MRRATNPGTCFVRVTENAGAEATSEHAGKIRDRLEIVTFHGAQFGY
jgi:hypothetical protein